jgi:uncharacterized RDD family membrane protein YckC
MFCPKCGQQNDPMGTVKKQVATGAYAGFWVRVVAAIIDSIVMSVISGALAVTGVGIFGLPFVGWLYEALMLNSEKQATVGKIAMGLIVTDTKGQRLTFARATGRHFAKWLSTLTLGIGFIMVAFTEKKQGLHDLVADTVVIKGQT